MLSAHQAPILHCYNSSQGAVSIVPVVMLLARDLRGTDAVVLNQRVRRDNAPLHGYLEIFVGDHV